MKSIILAMIVSLFVVGCSSKKKEVETTVNEEVQQVQEAAEEKVEEVKTTVEETVDAEATSKLTCSVGSDERTVEIIEGDSPKCEVFYTKNGERLSIARANWDVAYCTKVLNQVKGNLENAGFSCN